MVRDVETGDGLIGMILLKPEGEQPAGGPPDTWTVGCAGRMIRKAELPDGRSNVLLRGVREFVCRERFDDRPYRTAEVDWRPEPMERALEPALRERILERIRTFVGPKREAELPLLADPDLPDDLLVNLFGFALELPPDDKQGILEESSLAGRANRLLDTLEFQFALRRAAPGGGPDLVH